MKHLFPSCHLLVEFNFLLTHYYVKYHHQDEADGKADGAEIGMLTVRGFGNQFLDHDVEHGSGGKGEHVGEDGHQR